LNSKAIQINYEKIQNQKQEFIQELLIKLFNKIQLSIKLIKLIDRKVVNITFDYLINELKM
jgi:hypothetical protein